MSNTAIVFIALALVAFIIIVASLSRRGTGRGKGANIREENMAVFIIEKIPGEDYHMISGEYLEYNLTKAKSMGKEYEARVQEIMKRFEEKRKEPRTFYLAVEVDQTEFRNGNTNIPR